MDSTEARLLAEQLGRMVDSINARMNALEERQKHHSELDAEKYAAIRADLSELKDQGHDHELRLRAATDGVTSFRVWSGLAAGGSSIVSIIALVKGFFLH